MAVISYKCPNCDGELIFDPATQKYKCEYCNSLFSQEELDAMKPAESTEKKVGAEAAEASSQTDDQAEEQADEKQEEAVYYTCPSCGAEIVTDATTAATFCYYCHNPVVLGGRLDGKFLPDKVIPFQIDRKKAEETFLGYVSKKKFVPRGFFSKKNIEKLSSVYFPYWLYSVKLKGKMNAEAKCVRTWVAGDEEITETKVYELCREGDIALANLPENALKKANAILAKNVQPYHFDDMKDFHMGYLSGFLAEKRDIESEEVQQKLRQEMRHDAEQVFRDTMTDYGIVNVHNSDFHAEEEKWQYVLLPVWTVTYKGNNGKIYYYSMNGQTGQICGELPIDWKKVILTGLVTFVAVLILGLLGGRFIW